MSWGATEYCDWCSVDVAPAKCARATYRVAGLGIDTVYLACAECYAPVRRFCAAGPHSHAAVRAVMDDLRAATGLPRYAPTEHNQ